MKCGFLALLLIITGTFGMKASAQTIVLHHDRIGVGATVTIRNSDRLLFTHQYIGEKRGIHRWNTYAGKAAIGNPISVSAFDSEGNVVNVAYANGDVTRYQPHRCMRVVGTCEYARILPNGTRKTLIRTNIKTHNGFTYHVVDTSGKTVLKGKAVLDQMGWSKRGWFVGADGRKINLKMVASNYLVK